VTCSKSPRYHRQVYQVHALVQQFPAAGNGLVGAPLFVVADAAAVAVAPANEHQIAHNAAVYYLARLQHSRVAAQVEPDFDLFPGLAGQFQEGL